MIPRSSHGVRTETCAAASTRARTTVCANAGAYTLDASTVRKAKRVRNRSIVMWRGHKPPLYVSHGARMGAHYTGVTVKFTLCVTALPDGLSVTLISRR